MDARFVITQAPGSAQPSCWKIQVVPGDEAFLGIATLPNKKLGTW